MPAHRKLLPAPCPQCGQENGGCQIVIFNPEFNLKGRGHRKERPYSILRISHYSKERYDQNLPTKIWHNFQIHLPAIKRGSDPIMLDEIFDDSLYEFRQSITLRLSDSLYNHVKKHGWTGWMKIETQGAHWIKGLKQCYACGMYFKSQLLKKFDYPKGYRVLKHCWLCEACYAVDLEKVAKWKQQKPLILSKN